MLAYFLITLIVSGNVKYMTCEGHYEPQFVTWAMLVHCDCLGKKNNNQKMGSREQ